LGSIIEVSLDFFEYWSLQVPEAFQNLIDKVEGTMKFSLEVEEKIPLDQVTNFKEVCRNS